MMKSEHDHDACRVVCYAINGVGVASALAPSSCIVYFEYFFIFPGRKCGARIFSGKIGQSQHPCAMTMPKQ